MSELKKPAVLQLRHNNSEGFVYAYEKEEMDKYLSEVDKVIAELERKVDLNIRARQYWRKEWILEYKDNCHQKYKRCLAMAKACEETSKRMYCEASTLKTINEIFGKEPKDAAVKKFELWGAIADTHRKRWLKIAEQFKEVK